MFSYWGNSYWGGSVAAIGGLLVLGSIPRVLRQPPGVAYIVVACLGVLILANSRPYEGLVLCAGVFVAVWMAIHKDHSRWTSAKIQSAIAVLLVSLVAAGILTGYYFWR